MIDHHPTCRSLALIEYRLEFLTHTSSLILLSECPDLFEVRKQQELDHRGHFALTILSQPTFVSPPSSNKALSHNFHGPAKKTDWVDAICRVFECTLLFQGPVGDQWNEGKHTFRSRV
jgi:hypothetical protein